MSEASPLRARLEALVDRALPGVTLRTLWVSCACAVLLTLFLNHSGAKSVPQAFVAAGIEWTGIRSAAFQQFLWSHGLSVVLLMLVPMALMWLIEGEGPRDLGFKLRGSRSEFELVLVMWLLFLPALSYASGFASFQRTYPRLPAAGTDAWMFAAYHGAYLVKWVSWEFFFRGFVLLGLKKDLGHTAALVGTLPFVISHWGKPELEMLGSLPAGLVLCWIVLRSGSIWPGVWIHWMVAMTMDFLVSEWWR
ncbi:MAG: CPBP family intramembrane metalloprotease [Alphaproteobacteria bacterium]|nr:CPBP family intramembrane metalloprotease [Alphaproteobacteria bacterium]